MFKPPDKPADNPDYLKDCRNLLESLNQQIFISSNLGTINCNTLLQILTKINNELNQLFKRRLDQISRERDDVNVATKFFPPKDSSKEEIDAAKHYANRMLFQEPQLLGISSIKYAIKQEIAKIQGIIRTGKTETTPCLWAERDDNRLFQQYNIAIKPYANLKKKQQESVRDFSPA